MRLAASRPSGVFTLVGPPSPNPRMQRTPSAPLMRKPLGGRSLVTSIAALVLASWSCRSATDSSQPPSGLEAVLQHSSITVEHYVSNPDNPRAEKNREPLALSDKQTESLRELLLRAFKRDHDARREGERLGLLWGGVPGCVSYEYRLLLAHDGVLDAAWLHCGPGWLDAPSFPDTIVFTESELCQLDSILGRTGRSCG